MPTLAELARRFGGRVRGAGDVDIVAVAPLARAGPGQISFLHDRRHRPQLATTRAAAVILRADDAEAYAGNALIVEQPQLCFARVAAFLHPPPAAKPGIHPSAVVDPAARVAATASIGANAVVEADAVIGEEAQIGPGCYVGRDASIGAHTRLVGHVWIGPRCVIGTNSLLHPGAVIGADGFGFTKDGERWVKIPQLGRVVIGNDVEIGANTTIDCGTFSDTEIADGVKLDNLIQIGHNVRVGEHTIMAACVGIAGSTTIGRRCVFAGQVGVADHVSITDDVTLLGKAMVTNAIDRPGSYASGIPVERAEDWRRRVARFRHLEEMAQRLKQLEKEIEDLKGRKP
ncbi:MAG: UDP-3-O-(3-hydroxymyristoyl)glucosamine N-acyltransferase [Sulfurifustis sp.]